MGIESAIIGSAVVGGLASRSAAKKQAKGAKKAAQLQQEQYLQTREDQMPFLEAGYGATNRLNELLGLGPKFDTSFENFDAAKYLAANPDAQSWVNTKLGITNFNGQPVQFKPQTSQSLEQLAYEHYTSDKERSGQGRTGDFFRNQAPAADYGKYARDFGMQDFQADPGYAFRLNEGMKALDRQAAARGGLISGGALKAAQRYGQDLGSQEYQNAFNRYQVNRANQLTPLQSMSGMGQTTAQQLGSAGQNYATNAGNAYGAAAQAQASGYMGAANAIGQGVGQYMGYQSNNSLINALNRPSGGGAYIPPNYAPTNFGLSGSNVRFGA
jgi:hypothetical protein